MTYTCTFMYIDAVVCGGLCSLSAVSSADRCCYAVVCGRVRSCAVVCRRMRSCAVVCGRVRSCPVVSGRVRSCVVIYGRVRPCAAVCGRVRSRAAVCGRVRSCGLCSLSAVFSSNRCCCAVVCGRAHRCVRPPPSLPSALTSWPPARRSGWWRPPTAPSTSTSTAWCAAGPWCPRTPPLKPPLTRYTPSSICTASASRCRWSAVRAVPALYLRYRYRRSSRSRGRRLTRRKVGRPYSRLEW